ncbi:MAG: glycosyltransferase, partial [Actinomycetes bacterium]
MAKSREKSLTVSVVIPVYSGADTLPQLLGELAALTNTQTTPGGREFAITEVLLVWDRGPGRSDEIIRQLKVQYPFVKPIWLSRNFGQHAATLAGMTSASGDWIVTMDEDGQQDPAFIGPMVDLAYEEHAQLIYADPTNDAPHGALRNAASKTAKWLFVKLLAGRSFAEFNSYRLILGEVGRSVAAYTGSGVYLDVALSWVVADVAKEPVVARAEGRPA